MISTFLCQAEVDEENYPFVAPYTFKILADFIYDPNVPFEAEKVFNGAVVYVKSTELFTFFSQAHRKIKKRYILITHGTDQAVPGRFVNKLNDSKIIAWLGRNPSLKFHKKFHAIPIGINARKEYAAKGVVPLFKNIMELDIPKEYLLYLNINVKTNGNERGKVYDIFSKKQYCYCSDRKPMEEYLSDLKKSFFVLSPTGHGLDCFRTWEAILLGSVPIVTTSYLDPLLKDLPVIIVKDWNEVNESFLRAKIDAFYGKEFSLEKLYISYWKAFIGNILKKEGIRR